MGRGGQGNGERGALVNACFSSRREGRRMGGERGKEAS